MSTTLTKGTTIKTPTKQGRQKVVALQEILEKLPQIEVTTWHTLHGGIYSRTIKMLKDTVLAGAVLNVPTTLIVSGKIRMTQGDSIIVVDGYSVIPASKFRKQAIVAYEDTFITMCFKTSAKTIEEAEKEMTDEYETLMSRRKNAVNHITITGE